MKKHLLSLALAVAVAIIPQTLKAQCGVYSPDLQYYEDADLDGDGNLNKEVQGCMPCVGWDIDRASGIPAPKCVLSTQDCDESNPNVNSNTVFYLDNDGDGYYTQTWKRADQCIACESGWEAKYACRDSRWKAVEQGVIMVEYNSAFYGNNRWQWQLKGFGDCNDNNPFINPETVWYLDRDKDAWFTASQKSCTKPGADWYHIGENIAGKPYVAYNLGDCNDNDAGIYQQLTIYPDADGDGYRASDNGTTSCTSNPPAGYTVYDFFKKDIDCDDNNAAVYRSGTFYKDEDHDWYLVGPYTLCYGATDPVGYLPSSTPSRGVDCNDNDYILRGSIPAYIDADGDYYAASSSTVNVCFGNNGNIYVPQGYLLPAESKGLDCDDNNNFYRQSTMFYKDADNDGYPALGYDSVSACSPPAGYSNISNFSFAKFYGNTIYDCDDNNANAYNSVTIYKDADYDGIPANLNAQTICLGGSLPDGYVSYIHPVVLRSKIVDIDDNDPAVYYSIRIYQDTDGDKYPKNLSQPTILKVGDGVWNIPSGYIYESGGMWNINDCDDNNASIKGGSTYYIDNDHDGLGSGTTFTICPAVSWPPYGYASSSGDCDDNDPNTKNSNTWYFDADGDGSPSDATIYGGGCSRPSGAKKASELSQPYTVDCDDTNPNIHPTNVWYRDADNDGYSDGYAAVGNYGCALSGFKRAFELTATSGDCNDNNPAFNPGAATAVWYQDADGDGFGNASVSLAQCPAPSGYVANDTDCDDTNNKINPNSIWFKDNDNDNLTDGTTINQCARPTNYKLSSELAQGASSDCDDENASTTSACVTFKADGNYSSTMWLRDDDGDGYTVRANFFGNDANLVVGYQCAPGCNWVCFQGCTGTSKRLKGWSDCDDQNPNVNALVTYYVDADSDGYASSTTPTVSICPISPINSSYKTPAQMTGLGDCNDNDANIKSGAISGNTYYRDADGDGFGDSKTTIKDCSTPSGYVTNSDDCNDALAAVHPNTIWYKDGDNDDFTDSSTYLGCTAPVGFKLISSMLSSAKDCNDDDSLIFPTTVWYKDADNDGLGDGTKSIQCLRPINYKLASELIDSISDCNDADVAINAPDTWYKDADNDGHSDGITTKSCTAVANHKLPSALSSTNGDCDDNNAAIKPGSTVGLITWYEDLDKDGFGNPNNTIEYCKQPNGYVNNNLDCNDDEAVISPNTKWYKDQDNDGYSDGSAIITQCEKPVGYKQASELITHIDSILTPVPATRGLALRLDGVNDYFSYQPPLVTTNSNYTFEFWAKWEGGSGVQVLFVNGFSTGYNIHINGNGKYVYSAMGIADYPTTISPVIGQWTHFALTRDNTTSKFYIDGVLAASTNDGHNTPDMFTILGAYQGQNYFYKGYFDEFKVWNRALTLEEINANKNIELKGNEPGLIHYYDFNQGIANGNNTSGTLLNDKCSNPAPLDIYALARTGTNSNFVNPGAIATYEITTKTALDTVNVTFVPTTGQALHFNQAGNNYVNIPDNNNSLDLQNEFTIEAWINPADAENNTIVDKGDYKYLLSHNPNGYSALGFYRNGTWVYNTMTIPTNTWTHVALTYSVSNNEIKFYQNGVQVGATHTGAATVTNDNAPVNIGRQSPVSCACNPFNGTMDEIRLWNKVRTAEEILANYNKEILSQMTGLVGNYHFNQGIASGNNTSITSATDESGNNNNGTLVNFTRNGATSNFVSSGAIEKNYQTFGGDCDDTDPNQFKEQLWYKDADNDNISDGTKYIGCQDSIGFKPAYALKALTGDCNDNNSNEYPNITWYKDLDGDGYTEGSSIVQCTQPVGYSNAKNFVLDSTTVEVAATRGLALNFNSSASNYINIPDNNTLDLQNEFTIETWINPSDQSNNTIIDKGDYKYLFTHNPGGESRLGFYRGNWIYNTMTIPSNTWTHVALTYSVSSNEIKFYQNGVQVGPTLTGAVTVANDNGPINIGRQNPTSCACNTFNGSMDEMRLWNKVRTSAEILAYYNKEITTTNAGLVGNFHFNQGIAAGDNTSITNVVDASGNNNSGTLTGFTKTGSNSNFVNPGGVKTYEMQLSNLDCNDNDAKLNPAAIWYRDFDGDTLGDPLVDSISCDMPLGYVSNDFDANDSTADDGFAELMVMGNYRVIENRDTISSILDNTFFANICQNESTITNSFTIKNNGTDTLDLRVLNIIGDNADLFSIIDTLGRIINPKDSINVNVRFTPSAAGKKRALLYIASNDASDPNYFFKLEANVRGIDSTFIYDTICAGTTYAFNGDDYDASGIYLAQKTNKAGCDSTVILNLHVIGSDVKSNISGIVSDDNNALTDGQVVLYQMISSTPTPIDTALISNGNYVFNDLEIGDYKLKYSCGTQCGIVPTYYDATFQYQKSKTAKVLGCPNFDNENIDIKAKALKTTTTGSGTINGNISSGAIIPANARISATYEGISVFLVDDLGDVVGYTETDENGDFTFVDVPNGDYKIIADLVGYKSDTSQVFTIGTLNSNLNAALCIDEPSKTIGVCDDATYVKPKVLDNLNVSIYPNPTSGVFTINTSVGNAKIIVLNGLGEELLIENSNGNTKTIDLSGYPNGVYILQIISENGIKETSIIKN
jgi:hypothetical protein